MDLNSGVKRKSSTRKSRMSRGGAQKGKPVRKGRNAKKLAVPKTAVIRSKKSVDRMKFSRANSGMSFTELQFLAKERGIPFGGLSRAKLAKKINNYMY